jgi:hypothetical protein
LSFYELEISKLAYFNTVITAQLSSALEEKKIIMDLIAHAEIKERGE